MEANIFSETSSLINETAGFKNPEFCCMSDTRRGSL